MSNAGFCNYKSTCRSIIASFLFFIFLVLIKPAVINAETIKVPEDHQSIQAAIDAANTGDIIMVAPQTYYEAINFNGKRIQLHSTDGPDVTIIDATGLDASAVTFANNEDIHTAIKGFTITGGTGTLVATHRYGGGIYIYMSNPIIVNCNITGNSSDEGGAVYLLQSNSYFSDCNINGNACLQHGGAVHCKSSNITILDCSIMENTAAIGAGIYNYLSSPVIINTFIQNNIAYEYGGGIYNDRGSNPYLEYCKIISNQSRIDGGGIYNCHFCSPQFVNGMIKANLAANDGGGMYNLQSYPEITQSIMVKNSANNKGGAVFNFQNSEPVITNCTIVYNYAYSAGGGIHNWDSYPIITNSILWHNSIKNISTEGVGLPVITYTNIEQGYYGEGNIDADPMLKDPDNSNYKLTNGSPCIDAGNNNVINLDPVTMVTDLDGNYRLRNDPGKYKLGKGNSPIVDIGAYEYQFTSEFSLTITPTPIINNKWCDFVVTNAAPQTETWLLYSTKGADKTYLPDFNITIDLTEPYVIWPSQFTNKIGMASWSGLVDIYVNDKYPIWLQAIQYGTKSNLYATHISPW